MRHQCRQTRFVNFDDTEMGTIGEKLIFFIFFITCYRRGLDQRALLIQPALASVAVSGVGPRESTLSRRETTGH